VGACFYQCVLLFFVANNVWIPCRLGTTEDRFVLRDGIQLFLHRLLPLDVLLDAAQARKVASYQGSEGAKTLKRRLKGALRALDSVKGELEEDFIK
jgi:hypothetical protein